MNLRLLIVPEAISLAHVSRCLKVAVAARERGHQVRIASAPPYRHLLTDAGFDVQELYSVPPSVALRAIRRGRTLYTREVLRKYVDSDLAVLRGQPIDAVIGDLRLSLDISSELAGVPYVSILNAYWTPYYAPPLPAPETFPVFRILGRTLSRVLMPRVHPFVLRRMAVVFNRLRARLGLEPRADIFDVMGSRGLTLLADLPEFAPCRELPEHIRYVGPFLWEADVPPPPWLSEVDPAKPTVYVTMGSTGITKVFVRVLHELVNAGFQVMTTTCGQVPPSDVPRGCFAADLAPTSALLSRATVTLCHGGNGTIYQALAHGVPIVGIPTFHDQEFNMDRVVALGVGERISPLRVKPAPIRAAVTRVIEDPSYRDRAGAIGTAVRSREAARESVWNIEKFLLQERQRDAASRTGQNIEHQFVGTTG